MEKELAVEQQRPKRAPRAEKTPKKKDLKQRIADAHLHPIMVHFPNALFPVTLVLLGLYYFTKDASFEQASFYTMIFGLLGVPGSAATGLFSWKTRFRGNITQIFVEKMIWSSVLLILATTSVLLRAFIPDIAYQQGILSWGYVSLVASLTLLVVRLGFLGGKLVFF